MYGTAKLINEDNKTELKRISEHVLYNYIYYIN